MQNPAMLDDYTLHVIRAYVPNGPLLSIINKMSLSNNTTYYYSTPIASPPSPSWLDYAQIGYFASMIAVGVPLNLITLIRTAGSFRHPRTYPSDSVRLLAFHLALTDLMILCFFALSKLVWWSTYQWLGGDFLCRSVQFLSQFAFCSCSNLVASVAIFRLVVVRRMTTASVRDQRTFKICICLAYSLAFMYSTPQLYVWQVIHPFPKDPHWAQCVTKWTVAARIVDRYYYEKLYGLFSLLVVFWLPLLIVVVCYLAVYLILRHSIRQIDETVYTSVRQFKNGASTVADQSDINLLTVESSSLNNSTSVTSFINHVMVKRVQEHRSSLSMCTLLRAKRKLIKKTAHVLVAYICCWSSYNLLALCQQMHLVNDSSYWRLLYYLVIFNAIVNPFIYGVRRQKY